MTDQRQIENRHRSSAISALAGVAIAAAAALWPMATSAAPTLTFGNIDIGVWGGSVFMVNTVTDLPRLSVPLGDPARSELFVTAPEDRWHGFTYGTPTANNDRA